VKINKGKRAAPRRVLLYGVAGVGKSTWAAKAPGALFLNIEDGLADIDCDSTQPLRSFSEVIDAINWLITEEHDYKTVVIDSLDWVEKMIHRDIAIAAGKETIADIDFAKGYERAEPKWRNFLDFLGNLRAKGIAVILLAHSRVQKFVHPELGAYDRYVPDLYVNSKGEGPVNTIMEWCDEILFASYRTYTKTEGKGVTAKQFALGGTDRYVRTRESATCIAKNRLSMPEEIDMEFLTYASYVKAARPAQGNIEGIVVSGSSKVVDRELAAEAAEVF
jgi:hypothetical protein